MTILSRSASKIRKVSQDVPFLLLYFILLNIRIGKSKMRKKKNVKEKIMQHNVIKGKKNLSSVNGCQIKGKNGLQKQLGNSQTKSKDREGNRFAR